MSSLQPPGGREPGSIDQPPPLIPSAHRRAAPAATQPSPAPPPHEELRETPQPAESLPKENRLDRFMKFIGIGDNDRQSIRKGLALAYKNVSEEMKKIGMKLHDSAAKDLTSWQATKLATVIDHSHFQVNVKDQGQAKALLNERGSKEGDFILYRPNENAAEAVFTYLQDGDVHQATIKVNNSGQFSVKLPDGYEYQIDAKKGLGDVIREGVPDYKEAPPLTAKDIKAGFIQAGKEIVDKTRQSIDFITQQRRMSPEALSTKNRFLHSPMFEVYSTRAESKLKEVGDYKFTQDSNNPSKIILKMKTSDTEFPILTRAIDIDENGKCSMLCINTDSEQSEMTYKTGLTLDQVYTEINNLISYDTSLLPRQASEELREKLNIINPEENKNLIDDMKSHGQVGDYVVLEHPHNFMDFTLKMKTKANPPEIKDIVDINIQADGKYVLKFPNNTEKTVASADEVQDSLLDYIKSIPPPES